MSESFDLSLTWVNSINLVIEMQETFVKAANGNFSISRCPVSQLPNAEAVIGLFYFRVLTQ